MSPKTGQKLTDNPRNVRLEIRLTQGESEILTECVQKMNVTKTEVIKKGIELVKQELDENERSGINEHTKRELH